MFKNTCTSWAQYQPGVNDLNISHVRNYDLPDDVFQPGEVRPTRPKKKVVKKVEQTVSQKRNIDAVDGQEISESASKRHVSQNGMVTQATIA
ncbi:hypothetical protein H109_07617 [Trichophyton interdigitale MR816]|uniref:Poly(A) polymerase RNA-binding domain-containing protein n=2 Tax=Trichophyton TaxID=5550 RepID=A0A059IXQ5_TRIIM|nr:hypothetical protein H101_04307 [Trichophyton interdigitale H6]KDB20421.1 hypothetical protein H109_07617 [Trichophyton interdigitale MR816]